MEGFPLNSPASLVQGMVVFIIVGTLMVLGALIAGMFIRASVTHPEKSEPYECGEPVIGSSWVQYDLRFYVVALVFLIFDVEIALFYPWAVVYKTAGIAGLWDMLFFFGVLVIGFLYLWRFGYLNWVRSTSGQRHHGGPARPRFGAPRGSAT
jgi:NADH-quinone oxidoreductase subunit A